MGSPSPFEAERPGMTRLSKFAHRRGIARQLNATHGPRGWERTLVQTALPIRALALYAARSPGKPWDWRVAGRQRTGRWEWRWELRPR